MILAQYSCSEPEIGKKMRRSRVQLKRIENKTSRQVTFSKRRTGLLKKAHEISVLCDAQVALIIFCSKGKLTQYSSESSSLESILERYERHLHLEELAKTDSDTQENWSLELFKLTSRVEVLENNIRNYVGEDLDPLTLRELQSLEHQLDAALRRIRTRKNQIMNESISEMHRKRRELQYDNSMLVRKIKEKAKSQVIAEGPELGQEILRSHQCSLDFNTFPPQQPPPPEPQLPTLTLGGTSEARGEAEAGPSNSIVMPPWMLFHMTR